VISEFGLLHSSEKFDPISFAIDSLKHNVSRTTVGIVHGQVLLALQLLQACVQVFYNSLNHPYLLSTQCKIAHHHWKSASVCVEKEFIVIFRAILNLSFAKQSNSIFSREVPYPSPISPGSHSNFNFKNTFQENSVWEEPLEICIDIISNLPQLPSSESLHLLRVCCQNGSPVQDSGFDLINKLLTFPPSGSSFSTQLEIVLDILQENLVDANSTKAEIEAKRTCIDKVMRELALPVAATSLNKLSPSQFEILFTFLSVWLPESSLSGIAVLQAIVDGISMLPRESPICNVLPQVLTCVMQQLNRIPSSDLHVEEIHSMDEYESLREHGNNTEVSERTYLSAILDLITSLGFLDPIAMFSAIFPTLNACVAHFLTSRDYDSSFVLVFSITLRITGRLIDTLEKNPEITKVLLEKQIEMIQLSNQHLNEPTFTSPLTEIILCLQSLVPHMRALVVSGNTYPISILFQELCKIVMERKLELSSEKLFLVTTKLLASIAGTVRPSLEQPIADLIHPILPMFMQTYPAHLVTNKLVESFLAGLLFLPCNSGGIVSNPQARNMYLEHRKSSLIQFLQEVSQNYGVVQFLNVLRTALQAAKSDTQLSKQILEKAVEALPLEEIFQLFMTSTQPEHTKSCISFFAQYSSLGKTNSLKSRIFSALLSHPLRNSLQFSKEFHAALCVLSKDSAVFTPNLLTFTDQLLKYEYGVRILQIE
jgi:hypothetical protein